MRPASVSSNASWERCFARRQPRSLRAIGKPPVAIDLQRCAMRWAGRRFITRPRRARRLPGVATGLAVTGIGGDVLFVEAASMAGKSGLVLTGQLGDVMKESARIALTYVQSHAAQLEIDETVLRRTGVSHSRARRRDSKGWAQRRRHDRHGARFPAQRQTGEEHGRHDRRGHAARTRPADRRPETEGHGGSGGRLDGCHSSRNATNRTWTICRPMCANRCAFIR